MFLFQNEYTKYGATFRYLKKVMSLPYLPHEQIKPAFITLKNKLKPHQRKLGAFMEYVENQWIEHRVFQPKAWTVYKMSIRSNNDIEGYHHRLNRYVYT